MLKLSGLAFGQPRQGKPKTEAERKATHKKMYGNTKLPKRGTGLKRSGVFGGGYD